MGGGVGLLCCCDMVVAVRTAHATLSEVKLGVIPAVISPHVIRAIGVANAKRLFCTAESCSAQVAMEMGLLQRTVSDASEFPSVIKEVAERIQQCAPSALAATKRLMLDTLFQHASDPMLGYVSDEYLR